MSARRRQAKKRLAALEASRGELSVLIVSYALVRQDMAAHGVALDVLALGMRAADTRWAAVDAEIAAAKQEIGSPP